MIAELEAAPRGRYAGPVGWMDARGDGEFAIALRCAQLSGNTARLWAGAGIVAESEPDEEVAETRAKFDAVLSALL
jgi:menaquinone-specific isochorismate synthase